MITELLLAVIAAVAIGGIYYAFFRIDDEVKRKKLVSIVVVIIIAMSASLFVFNDKMNATETGQQTMLTTLQQLLGYTTRGYNPYGPDSWGGTSPLQDFDFDGVANVYDHDSDNDGVMDINEPQSKFNPMAPDMGIQKLDVLFEADTINLRVTPTQSSMGSQAVLSVYLDDNMAVPIKVISNFEYIDYPVDVIFKYDKTQSHTIELVVTGKESRYANTLNNILSYTIPAIDPLGIGHWYLNVELGIDGWVRNTKFVPGTVPLFSTGEDIFQGGLAGLPLWGLGLGIVIAMFIIYFYWKNRQMKKGKWPFKEKKPGLLRRALIKVHLIKPPLERHQNFQRGDINLEMWRRKPKRVAKVKYKRIQRGYYQSERGGIIKGLPAGENYESRDWGKEQRLRQRQIEETEQEAEEEFGYRRKKHRVKW